MTSAPTSRLRDLTLVLREVAWAVHRRAPDRAGVPIPTTELVLQKQILTTPGVTVGQLASMLGLRQPNVSAAIRVMVDKGLVTKEPSPDDRRIVRIVPTDLGRAEHEAIAAAWTRPVEEAIASLDPEHQRALEAASEALAALQEALARQEQGERD